MKKLVISLSVAAVLAVSVFAQAAPQKGSLEQVIALLDKASLGFKSVQTSFVWDQYTKAPDDHDFQSGVIYFRRAGDRVEMAADIQKPSPKYVLFTGGVVQVYLPRADEVTRYDAGKNREDFEKYLVLGFGGRGEELQKSFTLKYAGADTVEGHACYKLELTPKSESVRVNFSRLITLWIDQQSGMSVQQRFEQGEGNYKLAKYTAIEVNRPLPPEAFKLKTTSRTTYVKPR